MASWLMKGQGCRERETEMSEPQSPQVPAGSFWDMDAAIGFGRIGGLLVFLAGLWCMCTVMGDEGQSIRAVTASVLIVGGPVWILLARILECLLSESKRRAAAPPALGPTAKSEPAPVARSAKKKPEFLS